MSEKNSFSIPSFLRSSLPHLSSPPRPCHCTLDEDRQPHTIDKNNSTNLHCLGLIFKHCFLPFSKRLIEILTATAYGRNIRGSRIESPIHQLMNFIDVREVYGKFMELKPTFYSVHALCETSWKPRRRILSFSSSRMSSTTLSGSLVVKQPKGRQP